MDWLHVSRAQATQNSLALFQEQLDMEGRTYFTVFKSAC